MNHNSHYMDNGSEKEEYTLAGWSERRWLVRIFTTSVRKQPWSLGPNSRYLLSRRQRRPDVTWVDIGKGYGHGSLHFFEAGFTGGNRPVSVSADLF